VLRVEVTSEQRGFERTVAESPERAAYVARLARERQRSFRFGIRLADEPGAVLGGRFRVAGMFLLGDPGAVADSVVQAFLWTDVIASGSLELGKHIEPQYQLS
jgi:hypothetical protein